VQGDPVKQLEPGKAYLIEFWATWCGPCRESIPHVDELHKKYKNKGLIVIGTDVGEDQQRVKEFIEKMADKMTYRVALDETNAMVTAWFAGADENPIPFAFLVDPREKSRGRASRSNWTKRQSRRFCPVQSRRSQPRRSDSVVRSGTLG
jgi:thiol-disulfide isomerase/thioredoxin